MSIFACIDIPHSSVLCFVVLLRYCIFLHIEWSNTVLSNTTGAFFPTAVIQFVSLSHLVILMAISKFFTIIVFVVVI